MTTLQVLIVLCGLAAVLYGLVTSRQILSLGSGNDKMQEIAGAIQEGARAYLNRQYMTIAIVGVVIFALIWIVFDLASGIGFLIGAFFETFGTLFFTAALSAFDLYTCFATVFTNFPNSASWINSWYVFIIILFICIYSKYQKRPDKQWHGR